MLYLHADNGVDVTDAPIVLKESDLTILLKSTCD